MEEDLQGSCQVKEEIDVAESKQEPMEVEEKKLDIKVEPKEEEESGTNGTTSQSTSPSQPRKKSTYIEMGVLAIIFLGFLSPAIFKPTRRSLCLYVCTNTTNWGLRQCVNVLPFFLLESSILIFSWITSEK